MIDEKDLIQIKFEEIQIGGRFYLKNDDGSFSACKIEPDEIKDPYRRHGLLEASRKFAAEGRLFKDRNKPFLMFKTIRLSK